MRKKEGHGFLAEEALRKIREKTGTAEQKWIVDSIRNPAEVQALRNFSQHFFLFGIYADKDLRWKRVEGKYDGDSKRFNEDDANDTGESSESHGQKVGACFYGADVVISNSEHITTVDNEDFRKLEGRINKYVDLVSNPLTKNKPIRPEEALMAMAYAASQQSSCLKRKVGALIVDEFGSVISSGVNEVPMAEKPCQQEYRDCHRDKLSKDFCKTLRAQIPDIGDNAERARDLFRKHFKMLDYCRALHAEETAIVNLARTGRAVSLDRCTLYTTTYPCRLCANKITTIGIKRVVYLEPYPDQEAKIILKNGSVRDEFFEGVTFKAYFRIYGEER